MAVPSARRGLRHEAMELALVHTGTHEPEEILLLVVLRSHGGLSSCEVQALPGSKVHLVVAGKVTNSARK